MKKKIISCCLAVALVVVAVAGGTLAYFTDDANKVNDFTVGNVDIDIVEPNWEDAVEANKNDNMYPGQEIKKDPTVVNTGNNPVFVRVKLTNELSDTVKINYTVTNEWEKVGSYYYFKGEVAALDGKTTPIIENFTIDTATTNTTYGPEKANELITVNAEAVQSQGSNVDPSDANAIAAWFATCGK